jgi:hypothetical protein
MSAGSAAQGSQTAKQGISSDMKNSTCTQSTGAVLSQKYSPDQIKKQ